MPEYIPVKTETADIEKVQEETEETTSTQTESPAQKTITATEETAAAKAEDIQPEKLPILQPYQQKTVFRKIRKPLLKRKRQ